MAELLLELFSEEIPARMQGRAADDLKRLVSAGLEAAHLRFATADAHSGPRRLTLVVDGLPDTQPDTTEEKRGPRTDAPEAAIAGFLKANGLTLDQCTRRRQGRGEFWFAVLARKGRATRELLPGLLAEAIPRLPWPKSMRWGAGSLRWVRPLQRILCVFDGDAVGFDLGDGIPVGNLTSGHRFHHPEDIEVAFFKDYSVALYRKRVIVDAADRRRVIRERAAALAEAEGLAVRRDVALLAEVAGLVEWPVPLIGAIDSRFMDLPDEVLATTMRTHQKYFALAKPDGTLAPHFIVVANIEATDGGKAIIAGNERVLRARLADAEFFWTQDRKMRLEDRIAALGDIVFHARLGSLGDKVARTEALAAELARYVPDCDGELARRAAHLAKADLTTGMVGEFPGLQGVMGRYYALEDGERPEVAAAVAEHYSPAGAGDDCPAAPLGVAVALADRIDTLVGFWAIGETPTGSRDPFALRRAALGVIRLVLENGLRLPLREVLDGAGRLYAGATADAEWDRERVVADLLDFFADRLKVHLREKGVRHDLISAVFALGGEDDLVRLIARVEALARFLESDDGANLLTAHKRASNIVAIEEARDGVAYDDEPRIDGFRQDEEKALHASLAATASASAALLRAEDFDGAMSKLAELRRPVDRFFDEVTVNCDDRDLRANRLRLLSRIRSTMGEIADFSRIEGGEQR